MALVRKCDRCGDNMDKPTAEQQHIFADEDIRLTIHATKHTDNQGWRTIDLCVLCARFVLEKSDPQ